MKHYHARHRTFALTDKIYGQDITVIIGEEELFERWCKRNNIIYDQSRNYAETGEVEIPTHNIYYIHLPSFCNIPMNMAVAAHEILHVALRVMHNIGFEFSYDNTEPLNYYFEMLYKDFLEKVYR